MQVSPTQLFDMYSSVGGSELDAIARLSVPRLQDAEMAAGVVQDKDGTVGH